MLPRIIDPDYNTLSVSTRSPQIKIKGSGFIPDPLSNPLKL